MTTEFKYSYHVPGQWTYAALERIIHDLVVNVPTSKYVPAMQRLISKRDARPFDLDSQKYNAMYNAVIASVNANQGFADLQPEAIVKQNRRILWGFTDVPMK